LVSESAEQALENLKPQEPDLDELNYSAPSEPGEGFPADMAGEVQPEARAEAPQKRRLVAGPARGESERVLNRADRRKQKGR
jgi:hypothetical protein